MLKAGIIGAGHFGKLHAQAIAATPGVRLTAVCDEVADRAENIAAQHGAAVYGDWRHFLHHAPIDVVAIVAPHHLHRDMAAAVAEAGKHVLLEKPMALDTAECTDIVKAARSAGVKLMIGHLLHFSQPGLVAHRILESGELGRPMTGFAGLSKTWMESNRRDWHLARDTGGGMLMTAGIHVVDLLIWLMGGKVSAVSAASANFFHDQVADDTSMMLLRFADGRFGQVFSIGYVEGAGSYGATLTCERGTLRIDFEQGVSIGRDGMWTSVPNSQEPEWMLRSLEREWRAMVGAIRDDTEVAVTGLYGRHVIACIEAALRSAREGAEIKLSV